MSTLAGKSMVTESKLKPDIEMVLDQMNAIVYVTDISNFKIIYLNKKAIETYGNITGKLCWKFIQKNQTGKCPFCIIDKITKTNLDNNHFARDFFNEFNNQWFEVHEKIIKWDDNINAKLTVAYDITKRKEEEKKLYVLFKQQELFSKIATTFNHEETFANKVNEVIELLGEFVDVSRVSIFENYFEEKITRITYEWCAKGINPKINNLPEIPFDRQHPIIVETMTEKILKISDMSEDKYLRPLKFLEIYNVKALLIIPIYLRDKHVGFVSLEECRKKRDWLNNEIVLLKTFGNIISTSFERKYIEETRLRSEMKLKEANATKDRFFSIIARDLQSPFSSLTGLSSILTDNYDKWDDDKRKEFIVSIRESAKLGIKLLDNLLIWSKMQSGKLEFSPEIVDVRSVIVQTIEQLTNKAHKKGISITGVPEKQYFVYADYIMLNTIIRNIINNAIKFSKQGGDISIIVKEKSEFTEVCIKDNGIGIEKEHLNKLFRIDSDNLSYGPLDEKGTGLGLIICKEFIEKNGGKIKVISKLNEGSQFKFTIPQKNK
ncbi:MAG: GAF domain-containing sensor histidine kinase [Bacteroidales bacterium]|nr:GAF domain-containing sensor histidine kinase [Bacteroidales bacterium]MBN2757897.1 GAF domain-containing sensor histidine kinase [Bacteroidales bacterium]